MPKMLPKYSQLKFGLILGIGAIIALVLCIQCVRTYFYMGTVLVPQQAERTAARQVGALGAAARSAGISNPRNLGPVIEHALEAESDRVLWMRVMDLNSNVVAQAGSPGGASKVSPRSWDRSEKHQSPGTLIDTPQGKALVVMLPLRLPRPPRPSNAGTGWLDQQHRPADANRKSPFNSPDSPGGPRDERHTAYVLQVAVSLKAVAGSFEGLRQNLILGLVASIALLVSLAVIGFRAPHYVRGKYLESEMQLAKRVQGDLQPKPRSVSPHVEFAARAVAADHVGGDFYDIFEVESGKVAIVLGDVSGKGVPAALLVSVLHGAIHSSTASQHELACARINRMLCERTACERFATLFWGVFDPATNSLRYVNAGHAAPMLVRREGQRIERLRDGGPVLGLLPNALYSAGVVKIQDGDRLIVYSDGVNEAANQQEEEFGEARIAEIISGSPNCPPETLCERVVKQVTAFATTTTPQDDITLMVVKFAQPGAALHGRNSAETALAAVA
jgi:hypothetical protein